MHLLHPPLHQGRESAVALPWAIDMAMNKDNLTKPRVLAFKCPPDKSQAFLWDAEVRGLAVRATPNGKPAYVFQRTFQGETVRITIGKADAWSIPEARQKARALQRELDEGVNPVDAKRARLTAAKAEEARRKVDTVTVGEAWPMYLTKGRPKGKDAFRPRYLRDLELMASPGGQRKKRGEGETRPGPIYPLLALPIADLDEDLLLSWYRDQELRGREQAKRALMMFRGFLRWCASQSEFRTVGKAAQESARADSLKAEQPAMKRRTDAIESSQLGRWWAAVLELPNLQVSTYLRALVLTGTRRQAMASLRWADVDLHWKVATFTDKVYGTRRVPLGDELARLIDGLPRINEYVFYGRGKLGYLTEPRSSLERTTQAAGLEHVSVHGLRRTFALLAEEAGVPTGAAAQYMGHSPRGTHEGYKSRSLDQLRQSINRIEAHLGALVASASAK
jgi:integrase